MTDDDAIFDDTMVPVAMTPLTVEVAMFPLVVRVFVVVMIGTMILVVEITPFTLDERMLVLVA